MITNEIARLFRRERKCTDDSLIAERSKATQSLSVANVKSQVQTDEIVKDERSIADQKTAVSRASHDTQRNDPANAAVSSASQRQITEERRRSDLATEVERSKVDAAILDERKKAHNLVNEVLELERLATDESLSVERKTTDARVTDTSKQLTTRDEFLAIVSHDLKNPMGAVSSYADLLLEGIDGETALSETAQKYVRVIKRNADVSLRLIEDLLDVERISQGKLELHKAPHSINGLVSEAIERFQLLAKERFIDLQSTGTPSTDDIACDRGRILQVLGNLIGNALKFTPEQGQVTLNVQSSEADVMFSVCDSGPGIPAAKMSEVFERFAQLKSTNRDGLGLGLYISKMLVEAHGGTLLVESTLGQGSIFRFRIPR